MVLTHTKVEKAGKLLSCVQLIAASVQLPGLGYASQLMQEFKCRAARAGAKWVCLLMQVCTLTHHSVKRCDSCRRCSHLLFRDKRQVSPFLHNISVYVQVEQALFKAFHVHLLSSSLQSSPTSYLSSFHLRGRHLAWVFSQSLPKAV